MSAFPATSPAASAAAVATPATSGFSTPPIVVPRPSGVGQTLLLARQDAAWWALDSNYLPQGWSFRVRVDPPMGTGARSFANRNPTNPVAMLPVGTRYITDENGQYVPAIRTPGSPRPGTTAAVVASAVAAAAVPSPAARPPVNAPLPLLAPSEVPPARVVALSPVSAAPQTFPAAPVVAARTPAINAQTAVVSSAATRPAVSSFAMPPAGGSSTLPTSPTVKSNPTGKSTDALPVGLIVGGLVVAGVIVYALTGKKSKRNSRSKRRRS